MNYRIRKEKILPQKDPEEENMAYDFVTYKGKDIFYADYRGMTEGEMINTMLEAEQLLKVGLQWLHLMSLELQL